MLSQREAMGEVRGAGVGVGVCACACACVWGASTTENSEVDRGSRHESRGPTREPERSNGARFQRGIGTSLTERIRGSAATTRSGFGGQHHPFPPCPCS